MVINKTKNRGGKGGSGTSTDLNNETSRVPMSHRDLSGRVLGFFLLTLRPQVGPDRHEGRPESEDGSTRFRHRAKGVDILPPIYGCSPSTLLFFDVTYVSDVVNGPRVNRN